MDELVSIIVPVYNAEKYLQETLQSVCNQTYENWEAIVVDDGSTDNSGEIAVAFTKSDRRFRYFRQSNCGVSSARNVGFNFSSGKFIAFLDADDVWLNDNVASKVLLFKQVDHGMVHSDAAIIDSLSRVMPGILRGMAGRLLDYMLLWKGTAVPGPSSILVRREVLNHVGLFDTRLSTSADQDFFLRVARKYSIGHIPQITWRYRIHGKNMHKNILLMEQDVLLVFENARSHRSFKSTWFKRECFANMYLILAANWAGEGKNFQRGAKYALAALLEHPTALGNIFARLKSKWNKR